MSRSEEPIYHSPSAYASLLSTDRKDKQVALPKRLLNQLFSSSSGHIIGRLFLLAFLLTVNFQLTVLIDCLSKGLNSTKAIISGNRELITIPVCETVAMSETINLHLVICPPSGDKEDESKKTLSLLSILVGETEIFSFRQRKSLEEFLSWLNRCRSASAEKNYLCQWKKKQERDEKLPKHFCQTYTEAPTDFPSAYLCDGKTNFENSHLSFGSFPLSPLETRLFIHFAQRLLNETREVPLVFGM